MEKKEGKSQNKKAIGAIVAVVVIAVIAVVGFFGFNAYKDVSQKNLLK